MRAAQILAEMLLGEAAKLFAIIYGPGMPPRGEPVIEDTEEALFNSVARKLGVGGARGNARIDYATIWVARGYSILVQRNSQNLILYGQPIVLDPQWAENMQVQPDTPVAWYHHAGNLTSWGKSNAADALGVKTATAMTPPTRWSPAKPKVYPKAARGAVPPRTAPPVIKP